MNYERSILITFFGNYIINTILAAVVALIPAGTSGGTLTPQYITFVVLAVIVVAILTWWHMCKAKASLQNGLIFGIIGFLVAILTAFVTGIAGVLAQTGSFSQVASVLPNFWPFLASWSTAVLAAYWIIPALIIGWWLGRGKMTPKPMSSMNSTSGTM